MSQPASLLNGRKRNFLDFNTSPGITLLSHVAPLLPRDLRFYARAHGHDNR